MNQTSSPSGAESNDVSAISSELSQWLYLHTALGKGYVAPLAHTPAWIISAGVPVELTRRMREAENQFHEVHEESVAADRARLEQLEQTAQAAKGKIHAVQGGVGASASSNAQASSHAAMLAEIKDLKASLARPVFVNYRDWSADKSTILELLSKSKFRAMSFVDEMGIRAHNYTVNKFLAAKHISADLSLLSLIGDQSSDSVLIRSSATGGANILSTRGKDSPRFNLMTLTSPQAVCKLAGRLKEAAPCRGITVTLPAQANKEPLSVSADQIAKVIRKVYATDNPDNRVVVRLGHDWLKFIICDPSDYLLSEAAQKALGKSLCSLPTLVACVTRAIITRRFFLNEGELPGAGEPDRELFMSEDDCQLAQAWVKAVLEDATGTKHLKQRTENAAKARAARAAGLSPDQLTEARTKLIGLIQADPDGYLPWTHVTKQLGGARTLGALLEHFPGTFDTIADVQRPGSRNLIKQAVTLVPGWNTAKVLDTDGNELVVTHLPVGGAPTSLPGAQLDNHVLDSLYKEWQTQAHARLNHGHPAIVVADLPPPLRTAVFAVQKRHWQATTLLPSGPKPEGSDQRGLELWFRFRPDGHDMCAWKDSFLGWKFAEKWALKDSCAEEDRAEDTDAPSGQPEP